jgi:hypothetical protein
MNVLEQAVSTGLFPIDYGDRLRIGAVIPSGNPTVEPELNAMAPPGCEGDPCGRPLKDVATGRPRRSPLRDFLHPFNFFTTSISFRRNPPLTGL